MAEGQPGSGKPYDPFEAFRGMRDAYLDAMAKTMVEAVNSESYAQATGAMLDTSLTMSAPFRESMEKSMLQVLQQLSLPSRQDILSLAERFTNMEMRLDDIEAKLDRIARPQPAAAPIPPSEAAASSPETVEARSTEAAENAASVTPKSTPRKRSNGKEAN
jgi:hypothetical protein